MHPQNQNVLTYCLHHCIQTQQGKLLCDAMLHRETAINVSCKSHRLSFIDIVALFPKEQSMPSLAPSIPLITTSSSDDICTDKILVLCSSMLY